MKTKVTRHPRNTKRHVVTIFDTEKGYRALFSEPMPKTKAVALATKLRGEMRKSTPRYRFAKDIRVEEY
jgi:hypothetical protein